MVSWFLTVSGEILAGYEDEIPINTKKTAEFGMGVFTRTVSLF